jgi:hypothetical protein
VWWGARCEHARTESRRTALRWGGGALPVAGCGGAGAAGGAAKCVRQSHRVPLRASRKSIASWGSSHPGRAGRDTFSKLLSCCVEKGAEMKSGLSGLLANPLVMANLATRAAGELAGVYNQYQQGQRRDAIVQSIAAGHPLQSVPRGSFGQLLSRASGGLISPDVPVDPVTQAYEKLGLDELDMNMVDTSTADAASEQHEKMRRLQRQLQLMGRLYGSSRGRAQGLSDLMRAWGGYQGGAW